MRFRPAFTLTEILAATAILSVMFTIMFGILQQTSKGWQAANRRVEASQAARLALEQIAADLENCVAFIATNMPVEPANPRNRSYAFGFVHLNACAGSGDSWYSSETPPSLPNDAIFIAAPRPASVNSSGSDLTTVGYAPLFVARAGGFANTPEGRYVLCRSFPVSNGIPIQSFTNSSTWETFTPVREGGASTLPNFFPIVDHCVRFEIRFVYYDTSGSLRTNATTWGRPDTNSPTGWSGLPSGARPGLPLAADITLAVLDDRTAERLYRIQGRTVLPAGTIELIPTNLAAISQTNVQRTLQEGLTWFHRRVYFKNNAANIP